MSANNFDYLYANIQKIIELSYKAPKDFQESVFETLYKSLIDKSNESPIFNQINSIAMQKGINIQDCVNIENTKTNIDKTIAYVYYLTVVLGITASQEHISECYQICSNETISGLSQNLRDLIGKYNYLQYVDGYELTEVGKKRCTDKNLIKE